MAIPAHQINRGRLAAQSAARPKLKVVRPPVKQRSRVPFLALCLTLLIGSMLGALILNTAMASAAYEMHSTKIELARLTQTNQELATEVEELSAPARLADRATSLGMVPGQGINYINLVDNTVVGPAVGADD